MLVQAVCLLAFLECSLLVSKLRTFCHCRNSSFIISKVVSVMSGLYYFFAAVVPVFLEIDMTVARLILNFIKKTYPVSVTILFCGALVKQLIKYCITFMFF